MIYSADALVHKVPRDLPPHHAAFAEPLACSLHAVERAGITFDDTVVVAGWARSVWAWLPAPGRSRRRM